jgi:hypothetical protein
MKERQNDFSDDFRLIIGRNLMASLSSGTFKNYVILLIQELQKNCG